MVIASGFATDEYKGFIGASSKASLKWTIGALERLRAYHETVTHNARILAKIRAGLYELYGLTD